MILDDIKGLRVLITGASSGIGAAVALAFAEHGAAVAVHYNSSAAEAKEIVAKITAAGGKAVIVSGDVRDPTQAGAIVEQAVAGLGGLDVLINNAGGMVETQRFASYSDAIYDQVMDLNLRSVLSVTRAAHPHLKASGHGVIINTGSVAGRNGGQPGSGLYAASKAALHSLTKGMANEFAPDNIRVNTLAPGLMLTRFHAHTSQERLDSIRGNIPLRRLGTAEDCVGPCLFLASEAMSGYVTGQTIDVNGGRMIPG
ncbi:SDR family NAD(P)-dependent oxidoreductase [Bosea caraganae]|uniref:SDR family NAD(P)-dependent oxidoreductase n=1 Tax=Bosea caraganae TaxID=2763117 RepID=A0A370LAC4_9HYPH|nr:glucose 1-dehydrogenase [Bosea caraganae]RDJ21691.1 SDR family NAD(P)-dependent oxidoreductase [Bosea caraganae]RDJ28278.1 SDR family NAD(P)-dependent oxidoreductase [Bosea caraganae]